MEKTGVRGGGLAKNRLCGLSERKEGELSIGEGDVKRDELYV